MDFEKYHLYTVESEAALAKVEAHGEWTQGQAANAKAWAESKGGEAPLSSGGSVRGIVTVVGVEPVGAGWKSIASKGEPKKAWWGFNYKSKAGMKLEAECNAASLRLGTATTLASAIGAPGGFFRDRSLWSSQAWQMGDRFFLIVPERDGTDAPVIDGCRLLKLSEFYAMKEADEADPLPAH